MNATINAKIDEIHKELKCFETFVNQFANLKYVCNKNELGVCFYSKLHRYEHLHFSVFVSSQKLLAHESQQRPSKTGRLNVSQTNWIQLYQMDQQIPHRQDECHYSMSECVHLYQNYRTDQALQQ